MASKKAQAHKQPRDGKTQYTVPQPKIPKSQRDPGAKECAGPINDKKVPGFLMDSFAKPGWNR